MNILYLISYAGKAGTEKYVENLMRYAAAEGHTCHLGYWEGGELSEKAAAEGFPLLRLNMQPRHIFSAAKQLARYCAENDISVVHAQYPRENVVAVLSRLFRPATQVVFTSHLTVRQGLVWRTVNALTTSYDKAVIAVCTPGAALLEENRVKKDRIRVIFNGVEPRPLPPRENIIREEFSLGEDCFVFVTFARYAPEKGLGFLLDALALLKRSTARPFVCLIAGEGEEYERIGEKIRTLGLEENVIQAGYRTDTQALLCSSDAYVSSALYNEAMSFSILEAMSCGLPLAVTDVGAGRDLAAGCGYAAPAGDAAAMAENLRRLLDDPAGSHALGKKAYERVISEFDLRRQMAELLELYEK